MLETNYRSKMGVLYKLIKHLKRQGCWAHQVSQRCDVLLFIYSIYLRVFSVCMFDTS